MNLSDELAKLQSLRDSGAITDDEYVLAKSKVLSQQAPPFSSTSPNAQAEQTSLVRKLAKSSTDRVIGGVCGGLGKHTAIPSWMWRVMFCVGILSFGIGLIPYILLWIFVPAEEGTA